MITIFGCCRQESIYKYFKVSRIRNEITYTHNTKEVIQLIEYLEGKEISENIRKYIFRVGLLGLKEIDINKAKKEYINTKLFVIEIATDKVIEFEKYVAHEEILKSDVGDRCTSRRQTIEEIEEDIKEINKRLNGKIIIISHIYTKSGARSELMKKIKHIADKNSIKYLDVMGILSPIKDKNIFEDEEVLAHYTSDGHKIVGEIYKKIIEKITGINGKIQFRFLLRKIINIIKEKCKKKYL